MLIYIYKVFQLLFPVSVGTCNPHNIAVVNLHHIPIQLNKHISNSSCLFFTVAEYYGLGHSANIVKFVGNIFCHNHITVINMQINTK